LPLGVTRIARGQRFPDPQTVAVGATGIGQLALGDGYIAKPSKTERSLCHWVLVGSPATSTFRM
jgi:hypothetical protein